MTHAHFRVPTVLQASFSIGNMGEILEYGGADDFFDQDVEEDNTRVEDPNSGGSNGQIQDRLDDTAVSNISLESSMETHRQREQSQIREEFRV